MVSASVHAEDRWCAHPFLLTLEHNPGLGFGLFFSSFFFLISFWRLYLPRSMMYKELLEATSAKKNTAMQEVKGRSRLGLGPGVSLTWNCFSKSLSRQVWERVGGLGSFQSLLFAGSPSTKSYLKDFKPQTRSPKAVKGKKRCKFSC